MQKYGASGDQDRTPTRVALMGADLLPQYGEQQMDHHHLNSTSWNKRKYSSGSKTISVQTGHRVAHQIDHLRSKITISKTTSHWDNYISDPASERQEPESWRLFGQQTDDRCRCRAPSAKSQEPSRAKSGRASGQEPEAEIQPMDKQRLISPDNFFFYFRVSELKAVQHQAARTDPVDKTIVDPQIQKWTNFMIQNFFVGNNSVGQLPEFVGKEPKRTFSSFFRFLRLLVFGYETQWTSHRLPRTTIGHLHVPINFSVGQDQSTFGYFPDSHPLPPGASLLRETFGTESGRRTLNEVVNTIQGHGSASGQSSSWINIGTRVPA
ncbi:hypothetical protein B9Z55_024859 [Caenorhabditis nigoni]|uniref:Uncharacterized protein n=1 Tax=Caenorhabditis nigoni TaxID=1611254 RepID=A0A2G5SW40_9PELO|nr:hypothetical protein B9Z55_024859 [Caenorhabditis nigoni]